MRKILIFLIPLILLVSIFSISIVAAQSTECNFWCRLIYLFTGKMIASGGAIVPATGIQDYGGYGYGYGYGYGALCGNGIVEIGEQCDDGNATVPQTCGVGACETTVADTCLNDNCTNVTCVPGTPTTEICDGLDNDCDGTIDEGCAPPAVFHGEVGGAICPPDWICTEWSACSGGTQTRICRDINSCRTNESKPAESLSCAQQLPAPTPLPAPIVTIKPGPSVIEEILKDPVFYISLALWAFIAALIKLFFVLKNLKGLKGKKRRK